MGSPATRGARNDLTFYASAETAKANGVLIHSAIIAESKTTYNHTFKGINNIFFKNSTDSQQKTIQATIGDLNANRSTSDSRGYNNITSTVTNLTLTTGAITNYGNTTIKLGSVGDETNSLTIGKGNFKSYSNGANGMNSHNTNDSNGENDQNNKYAYAGIYNGYVGYVKPNNNAVTIEFKGANNTLNVNEQGDGTNENGGNGNQDYKGIYQNDQGSINISFFDNGSKQTNTLSTTSITNKGGNINLTFGKPTTRISSHQQDFITIVTTPSTPFLGEDLGTDTLTITNDLSTNSATDINFKRNAISKMSITNGNLNVTGGTTNITFAGNGQNTLELKDSDGSGKGILSLSSGGRLNITASDTTSAATNTFSFKAISIHNSGLTVDAKGKINTFSVEKGITLKQHSNSAPKNKISLAATTNTLNVNEDIQVGSYNTLIVALGGTTSSLNVKGKLSTQGVNSSNNQLYYATTTIYNGSGNVTDFGYKTFDVVNFMK